LVMNTSGTDLLNIAAEIDFNWYIRIHINSKII